MFPLSPGVQVIEKDLTAIVPSVATTVGGFVGAFQWGPVEQVLTVDSENTLVERFGKPNQTTYESFFTAANFLAYGNNLQVIRVVGSSARNAIANASATAIMIKNEDHYENQYSDGSATVGEFAAKFPGTLGNSLLVSMADANTFGAWGYADLFDNAPNTSDFVEGLGGSDDELHLIIIDATGVWTGTPNTVLEKHSYLSKASDAKNSDGSSAYYKDVINNRSKYIWWMDHPVGMTNWGNAAINTAFTQLVDDVTVTLSKGVSADTPADGNIIAGLSILSNDEQYDLSLLPLGNASDAVIEYAIGSVAEVRKDCIVFVSPPLANVLDNVGTEADDIVTFRGNLPSTSYAVIDSGWKLQYDPYNDKNRWIPLNGDVAGCAVRTDFIADPWYSPAGFNRGQIKNVIKLAFSPRATDRDKLYKKGINPVVSFPGNGTVLYGDKTMLAKPSAFDRINVRRLFIVLEKAIATAAKFQLFEFNDQFTRANFRNLVEPYLREIQGRRGLTDFKVVCDESNNTGEVIDRNEFVADLYIKPNRSINFITLNFVATRTGVSFEEVGA